MCIRDSPNVDRVGLVLDVSRVLSSRNINIISMEVEPNTMYLEVESPGSAEKSSIIAELRAIRQVVDVVEIPLMPHEVRNEELKAVLASVTTSAATTCVTPDNGQLAFTFNEILYVSTVMNRVVTMAKTIASGDSTVLIRGETGTGKELFARAIHAQSARAAASFVPINCAAIPDTLLESELFGYEQGAFTGAAKGGKSGLFEIANQGTIFFDEIAELSFPLQAKLLRVLQDGKLRRVGGSREIAVNVRVLAATNRNLEDMIAAGRFREDLYYRLNVIPLFIPPLRSRPEDIPLLAQWFIRRFALRLRKPVIALNEIALYKLVHYSWPGNVRELENVIERAINLADGATITADHIVFDHDYMPQPLPKTLPSRPLDEIVAEVEKDVLTKAICHCRSSRQLGAALGLSHTAVIKKLKKYGLTIRSKP
ncbi:MAG: sigma 54-interacting transcriptional regulator [Negativicutes bacterium]|nr:sigma 54-interacting transcriptional regulator [Negativicutes bacterium]